jgi:hypothetical protein
LVQNINVLLGYEASNRVVTIVKILRFQHG